MPAAPPRADVTVLVTGAPTNLRYATNPATYMAGVAIAANAPAWDGGTPTSFTGTVAPGLVLDATTGIVTGTPVTVAPATPYTITASNASGSATVVLNVTVLEAVLPPTSLVYSANPAVYTVGTPIAPNLPVNSGGLIAAYTVSPTTPLPAGLSLDTATGILTGTPTAITTGPTTCTVTGQNAAGVTSVDLVVTVNNSGARHRHPAGQPERAPRRDGNLLGRRERDQPSLPVEGDEARNDDRRGHGPVFLHHAGPRARRRRLDLPRRGHR